MSRRALTFLAIALFVGFGIAQRDALDVMRDHGTNVFAFEFIWSTERAEEVLREWGDAGRDAAREQLLLDFGFMAGYGMLLWLLGMAVGAPRLAALGAVAAVCDALENAALLLVVEGHTGQPWPALGTSFASVKFATAAISLFGALGLLVARTRGR